MFIDYNDDETVDQSKLQNDLDAAKPAVRQKEIDKQEAIEAKAECEKRNVLLEKSQEESGESVPWRETDCEGITQRIVVLQEPDGGSSGCQEGSC